jgi:hypothetical protein
MRVQKEKPCPVMGQGFSADGDGGFRAYDAASTTAKLQIA